MALGLMVGCDYIKLLGHVLILYRIWGLYLLGREFTGFQMKKSG